MKQRFNYSGVHKSNARDAVNRSVTKDGISKLRAAYEDAKLRLAHREEITGSKHHE